MLQVRRTKLASADANRRIFGIAIKPDTLAMHLTPPWSVRLASFGRGILLLVTAVVLVAVLVQVRPGRMIVPAIIVTLSILAIAADDLAMG